MCIYIYIYIHIYILCLWCTIDKPGDADNEVDNMFIVWIWLYDYVHCYGLLT